MSFSQKLILILVIFLFGSTALVQSNFQGVTAGSKKTYRFMCNPKTKQPMKVGKFQVFEMIEMKDGKMGDVKTTYCPTGTCDSAVTGFRSLELNPFTPKMEMFATRIARVGNKTLCKEPAETKQQGNKSMKFVDPIEGMDDGFSEKIDEEARSLDAFRNPNTPNSNRDSLINSLLKSK